MVVVTLSEHGYIKELSVDMDVQVTPGPISATPELQNLQQANRGILSDPVERTHVYTRQDLMALRFYRFKVNTDTIQILKVLGIYRARGRRAGRRKKYFNRIQEKTKFLMYLLQTNPIYGARLKLLNLP